MKKLIVLAAVAFSLAACNNADNNQAEHMNHDATNTEVANQEIDPVCNMVKTDAWTLSSVVENDTIHFCSPVCKETFDKNPAAFLKK